MGHRDSDIGVTDLEVSSSLGYRGYESRASVGPLASGLHSRGVNGFKANDIIGP